MSRTPRPESRARSAPGRRARLSRTLSRARFGEYRTLLRVALSEGYVLTPLERFLDDLDARASGRVLILRHDVDQHPASALAMARIERDLGVQATWYLRWRTADPRVIAALRDAGGEIGLHYETLTRAALERGLAPDDDVTPILDECRERLRAEIASFADHFGACRSICAHGDTRVPWLRNLDLVDGRPVEEFGVRYDANLALRAHRLGLWLTDRTAADGRWADGVRPAETLAAGVSPVLCLTHPNNWAGGPSLWRDRVLARLLPAAPATSVRVPRTRSDRPAL